MNVITANELKLKGVTILEEILKEEPEALISVRGKPRFVVMKEEQYDYLRECELSAAIAEIEKERAEGKEIGGSIDEHMKRVVSV